MTFLDPNAPRNIAIFDIGSNAVRLNIHRVTGPADTLLFKEVTLCEMGRRHAQAGYLYPDGVKKAVATLHKYMRELTHPAHLCDGVVAVATEAIRRAHDGPAFIQKIQDELGLRIQILTPEEEGVYGAHGVLRTISDVQGIVADLGGGSLQLTAVDRVQVGPTHSMPLGTLRLLAEQDHLDAYIDRHFTTLPEALQHTDTLYVIGGSWRALTKLYLARAGLPSKDVQDIELDPAKMTAMTAWLERTPDLQQVLMREYGIEKSRAETLPHAAHMLVRVLTHLGCDQVVVSNAGVRDGLLQAVINGHLIPHPIPRSKNGTSHDRPQP